MMDQTILTLTGHEMCVTVAILYMGYLDGVILG
jgi:hypothetical protein